MQIKSFFGSGLFEENSFLIIDTQTGTTAIVDPAFTNNSILEKNARIDYILLTHCHFDHVAAVNSIKEKYKSKIVCHEEEKISLADPYVNLSRQISTDLKIVPDICLKDEETMKIGELELKVIHTPGHTKGSCCYVFGEHIFTGDTVMAGTIGRTDLPTGNYNQIMGSVNKLKKLSENYTLHCGHGGDTKLDKEKKMNPYFG